MNQNSTPFEAELPPSAPEDSAEYDGCYDDEYEPEPYTDGYIGEHVDVEDLTER